MPIRVTCTGCHTRFHVSEKFAGREGPCPKCKKPIRIPAASEEVKIHAPESFGPKDVHGKAVLQPIFRRETSVTPVQWVLIGATIALLAGVALIFRLAIEDKSTLSVAMLVLMAVVVAIPCSFAAYSMLRDPELDLLSGQELAVRLAVVSAVYGLSWLFFFVANYALQDDYGTATGIAALAAMTVAGASMATLFLSIDALKGVIHFGFFLCVCLLLRWIAGLTLLPHIPPAPDDRQEAGHSSVYLVGPGSQFFE